MVVGASSSSAFLLVAVGVRADVEVPLESWLREGGGEGEMLLLLGLDFFVESFGLFGEDVEGRVADLWDEGVVGICLYLFLPLFSRVDLLRFGVCAFAAAAAVALLVSLALASFRVAVGEAAAAGGGGVCPSLGAPDPAAPPPDRVLAMDQ